MQKLICHVPADGRWCGFGMRLLGCCAVAAIAVSTAFATENACSVYPAGVDTVVPGLAPAPGQTLFLEFTDYYTANGVADSKGKNVLPGFHLGVAAFAVKIEHNWGVHILGGTLASSAALPFVHESLNTPFGAQAKSGFSNPGFEPAAIGYVKGDWHWWYGLDLYTPGLAYTKGDLVNVGQHNFAYAPAGAFTFLPKHGRLEISSKYEFIVNGGDAETKYRSGREFVWEYDGMVQVTRKLSIGGNGFFYRQVTADTQNGLVVGDGHQGRDLSIGPQILYHAGRYALVAKYQKDTLVQNRAIGDSFWFQFGVPVGHKHE